MVTILKAEVTRTRNGDKTYKAIELSNGMKASMWPTDQNGGDTFGYDDAVTGSVGDAEITSNEKSGKTYYNVISWTPKAGSGVQTQAQTAANAATSPVQAATDPWPAKDRGMDAESAYKSAAGIVVALIEKGEVKNLVDAQAAWDTLAAQAYGCMQDARANKLVYPGFDVFADTE